MDMNLGEDTNVPSDALYEALAKALSQPSRAYRTAQAALDVPNQALKGYMTGSEVADKINARRMGRMSLEELLGGQVEGIPEALNRAPVSSLSVLKDVSPFLTKKEEKEPTSYTVDQVEAIRSRDPKKLSIAFGSKIPRTALTDYSAHEKEGRLTNQFDRSYGLRSNQTLSGIVNRGMRDPQVLRSREAISGADRVMRLASLENALGDEALGFVIPRALEEVGNLAQSERTAVRINPNVINTAKSFAQRKLGPGITLTDQDREQLREIMKAFRDVSVYRLNNAIDVYADQMTENFGVPFEEAKKRFGDLSRITSTPEIMAAKDWLSRNPNDPKANAVRAKIKAMEASGGGF